MSPTEEWPSEAAGASDDGDAERGAVGALVAGRYRVLHKLGQGGMGAVFLARHEALGREVALKIVRGELARVPRHVERFRREAKTLSQLVHPNIVALYDFGEERDALLWFAMELLRGESLRDRLRARGALSVAESVVIARDICAALVAAHDRGVMHRDLKPDNVMVVDGQRPFVKLVDFGIAKAVGDASTADGTPLTQTGTVVGTPGYVPREISVEGIHDDPRSDLYALGVTWFEMLTGEAPFVAQTAVGLMMKHASDIAPRAIDVAPHVPPHLSSLVDRLLAKDRHARPASAQAVLALLDETERPAPLTQVTRSFAPLKRIVTQPFLDAPLAPAASAVTLVRNETPPSSPNVPELHVERGERGERAAHAAHVEPVEPAASIRLRPLLLSGAIACGLAVAAALALAIDDEPARDPAPHARMDRATPRVVMAPSQEVAPGEVAPRAVAPGEVAPRGVARQPEPAPVTKRARVKKSEPPAKLIDVAPKLLLDDKPKLME